MTTLTAGPTPDIKKMERFANWVPARVYWQDSGASVDWCYAGEDRFDRPFFDDTMTLRMNDPFSVLFHQHTPLDFLGELYKEKPGLAPNGFIFHMSRCGSTLVSQMLAALPQNIVISEAPPLNSILRSHFQEPHITLEQRAERLKWIAGALGQKRFPDEKNYFIKFDSWNCLDLEVILKAFPDVPWIFLYRNPVEVIVSQMRQRGAQMIPGALQLLLPGLEFNEILQMPPEEYCARVLAQFCENALQHENEPNVKFINYSQLPDVFDEIVLEHFGVSYTGDELARMAQAAQFNAKTPQMNFTSDSQEKRDEASKIACKMAANWVDPLYDKLEAARLRSR